MAFGQVFLLIAAALAVATLVAAIAWWRWHPFVALTAISLALGLAAGVPAASVVKAFQEGLGATLGSTAGVIALGAMIGRLLASSGGAQALTAWILRATGTHRAPWAFGAAGLVIGLPVFFSVGFVLLMPLAYAAVESTGTTLVLVAMPLAAGLSAAHGLTPPHPGPLAAIERLHADPGLVILYGVLAAVPATIVAGPLLAFLVNRRIRLEPGAIARSEQAAGHDAPGGSRDGATASRSPSVGATAITLLLPVLLMLTGSLGAVLLPGGSQTAAWLAAAGQPLFAMMIAVLAAAIVFGRRVGLDARGVLTACEESLAPIAGILLVVGAGGGFGRVLDVAGVDDAIVAAARTWPLSPLVLAWVAAVLLRVSVGSATVAITTTASLVAPLADAAPGTSRELLVVAMGAGSLAVSHVNDAGFWLVKEYFNASVAETLATWTVLETVIAVTGLAAVLLMSLWT